MSIIHRRVARVAIKLCTILKRPSPLIALQHQAEAAAQPSRRARADTAQPEPSGAGKEPNGGE